MPRLAKTDQTQQERIHRLLNRGAQLLDNGRAQEAISYLQRAHQIDKENVPALINLAGAYIITGHQNEAIPLLEAACEREPNNPMIWINLGAACLGNPILATPQQQMRAITAFQRALELDPTAPSVHYNLGLIYVDRREIDLAIAAFRQARLVNPSDRDAALWLQKLEASEGAQQ